ncbi:MAG: MBL fold metallo-hydrolase [Desulfotomaculaceae bacterium]|nr:MBL fold metallo-hydrolase [Desulfotomaculaceae bacterium]MDD4766649.1 MBL fold metallo-hydrolase [Desulfotomaculaceae bacterium]
MKDVWLKFAIISENTVGTSRGIMGEWGLSIYIEAGGMKVLFDTGESGVLLNNANMLGIDLQAVEAMVLSHGHYDHTGGMRSFLRCRGTLPVYAHPGLFACHCRTPEKPRYIGIPYRKELLQSLGAEFVFVKEPLEITPGVFISGEVPRKRIFENAEETLFCLENGRTIMPDPFHDDMSLYCVTPAGLFIVLGCAHAGLINIVEHGREVTGESRVYGIIGGTHLGPAPDEQQEATINYLKELDLQFLGANHCTGLDVIARLANIFGPRFKFCPAGRIFTIPEE